MTATAYGRIPEEGVTAPGAVRKILVADDNASSREFLRAVLEHQGYSVWEAGDGIDALETAREVVPDLIFLDLCMPGMDGFGVLREIRSIAVLRQTTIIAISASAMNGDFERARAAGFTRILAKPVSVRTLRAELLMSFPQA